MGSSKLRLKADWKPIPTRDLETEITTKEILKIHETLGHAGLHTVFQWFPGINLKVTWKRIKDAIN
jgi:hypothetical protein